jgi:hypothetical protein
LQLLSNQRFFINFWKNLFFFRTFWTIFRDKWTLQRWTLPQSIDRIYCNFRIDRLHTFNIGSWWNADNYAMYTSKGKNQQFAQFYFNSII